MNLTRESLKAHREYAAIHMYLNSNFTKPDACEKCKTRNSKRLEWANISGIYTRNIADYMALCTKCHRFLDRKTHCKYGHDFEEYGIMTQHSKGEWRECSICTKKRRETEKVTRKAYFKKYYLDNRDRKLRDANQRYADKVVDKAYVKRKSTLTK